MKFLVPILILTLAYLSSASGDSLACGGQCATNTDCEGRDCLCKWFICSDDNAARDVELFQEFLRNYARKPEMIHTAAKYFQKNAK